VRRVVGFTPSERPLSVGTKTGWGQQQVLRASLSAEPVICLDHFDSAKRTPAFRRTKEMMWSRAVAQSEDLNSRLAARLLAQVSAGGLLRVSVPSCWVPA
jgi:hypothetical protein